MTPGEWTPAPTPRELEERMTETVRQKLVNVCPGNPTPLSEEIAAAALAVVREALAEPTPEMIRAGAKAWGEHGNLGAAWQAKTKEALGDA